MVGHLPRRLPLAHLTALILAACSGGVPSGAALEIPGLAPEDEIEIAEVEPEDDLPGFTWSTGLQVEGLPVLSVGQPTEQFFEDAAHQDGNPEDYFCFGGNGGYGCDEAGVSSVTGHTFGGPEVLAWAWTFLPEGTAAVRFTNRDGDTTWQRPVQDMVLFPDHIVENGHDDGGTDCSCLMEALDANGEVVGVVHPDG